MKKFILLLIMATGLYAAITKATLPYVIANYSSPKTFMIDGNDIALRNVLNQVVDSTNRFRDTLAKYLYGRSFTGNGSIVYSNSPTITTPIIATIKGSGNSVTINSTDTLKSTLSNLGGLTFADGEIKSNVNSYWVTIDSIYSTTGYIQNLNGGQFNPNGIDVNGTIRGNFVFADDSLYGLKIESGRLKTNDIDVNDSIISKTIIASSVNTPIYAEKLTTSSSSAQEVITLNAVLTSGEVANFFGPKIEFRYTDLDNSKKSLGDIRIVRHPDDDNGLYKLTLLKNGVPTLISDISPLSHEFYVPIISKSINSDSSRVGAEYRTIRTVSSSGTATLTKQYSFVWVTASGVTLNLPDANGSGFSLETCSSVYFVNVNPAASGDVLNGTACSPSSGFVLGTTCGSGAKYHGLCAKFIDCANNVWCVFPTYD